MQRYKGTIEYDGSGFSGYQIQPKGRTIKPKLKKCSQKCIRDAILRLRLQDVPMQGSMRADKSFTSTLGCPCLQNDG